MTMVRRRLAIVALSLAAAGPARADLLSPGELAKGHASLEGMANCTKCHEAGKRLSPVLCLDCHKAIAARVAAGRGFHGRMKPEERENCFTCHHEHQGVDFPLVDWGAAGRKGFEHAKSGYPLEGKHAKVDCARCHDPRLEIDPLSKALLEKSQTSLLGAPTACVACHVDEHRGQLAQDCQRCHGLVTWKPARFDHASAAYKLTGKHVRVACAKCHADQPATAPAPTEIGARVTVVRAALTVRYKPIPFQACTECHKDPHQARFGNDCATCHVTADWKQLHGTAKERAFHEKTKYPLRGAHLTVKCEACHPAAPGKKTSFKGIPFGRCSDCHEDAHLGQLAAVPAQAPNGGRTCDRCHALEGYLPVRYEVEDHQQTSYKLEGAHRAVACATCHPKDPRLEAKGQRLKAAWGARGAGQKLSLALLKIPKANDCRTCHRDPHGNQFAARTEKEGCSGCHGLDSWKKVRFDHTRDTRFKLEGKHAPPAACASCHRPDSGGLVRYRPLPLTCAGCHPDPHAGQLAQGGKGTDCARCHDAVSWKEKIRFDHVKDSRFKLEGKHVPVACEKCHPKVTVAKGVEVRRYKPLPIECQACHVDPHKGAFRGFVP